MRKWVFLLEGTLQALVGLSALVSGALMVVFPAGGPMRLPSAMLQGSPFTDFLVPGLILFAVIGLGHATASVMSFRRSRFSGYTGAVMGLGLMIWIFVQVSLIGGGHWLQYLYFALGTAEVALAVLLLAAPER
jgi:hypothetical protein